MKKHLLFLICLLVTVSIPAQEVSRNLTIKSLQQGSNAQPVPFNLSSSKILTAISEETGFKCDSLIAYKFTSATDSVLAIKQNIRNNSEGINYFVDSWEPYWDDRVKWHFIYDELGNNLGYCIKGYWLSGDKRYFWAAKRERIHDTNGNIIKQTGYYWDGGWKYVYSWERYYSAEIPDPSISYNWYTWSAGLRIRDEEGFDYVEPKFDTLFLGDGYEGWGVVTPKIEKKYDELGCVILSVGYVWADVENQWVPSVKEEFMHGPSGLDTLHCGFRWDENEKAWELNFADTLIRDENGNRIDYKMTYWDNDHSNLVLWRRFVAEYDSENRLRNLKYYGGSSPVTDLMTYREWTHLYDIYGNEIFYSEDILVEDDILKSGIKGYKYYSPLEISTDASLWDVNFTGSGLRPVVNGTYSKTNEIFDDEIYEYVILNNGSNVIPQLTYIKNDPKSSVVVTEAKDPASANKEDRTTTITVTAEDGLTTQNYYFDFYKPNGIATLDTIIVSEGKLSPEFDPEILIYYDTIYGTCPGAKTPEVKAEAFSLFALVAQSDATDICKKLFNKTLITVVADDGIHMKYYKISFTVIDTISENID